MVEKERLRYAMMVEEERLRYWAGGKTASWLLRGMVGRCRELDFLSPELRTQVRIILLVALYHHEHTAAVEDLTPAGYASQPFARAYS
jgi:hypothetical protein